MLTAQQSTITMLTVTDYRYTNKTGVWKRGYLATNDIAKTINFTRIKLIKATLRLPTVCETSLAIFLRQTAAMQYARQIPIRTDAIADNSDTMVKVILCAEYLPRVRNASQVELHNMHNTHKLNNYYFFTNSKQTRWQDSKTEVTGTACLWNLLNFHMFLAEM